MHRERKFSVPLTAGMALWKLLRVADGMKSTCPHDVALLNGSVLQAAGLLLEPQGTVAHWQAGDHFFGDSQGTLADLYRMNLWL